MNTTDKENERSSIVSTIIRSICTIIVTIITVHYGGEKLLQISANISQAISSNISSVIQNSVNCGSKNTEPLQKITPLPETQEPEMPFTDPSSPRECYGSDWENCWYIDEQKKEMIWIGDTSPAADIGFAGNALSLVKSGYVTKVNLDEEMWINICIGAIDGKTVLGECPVIIRIEPGEHVITSPGESGGFRIYN